MDKFCKACGAQRLKDLGKSPDAYIYQCYECKSLFNYDNSELSENKDTSYGEAYKSALDETKVDKLFEIFKSNLPEKKNDSPMLLDIGCGYGSFLKMMRNEGWVPYGLDCDKNAISYLNENNINAIFGKLGEPIESIYSQIDVITLWDVIEHIDFVDSAMRWINSALKKNGYVFVITPNADSILDIAAHLERRITFRRSQKIMNICLNRYHLNRFSMNGLTILFNRYGFEIVKIAPVRLFSLKSNVYLDGFATGIEKVSSKSLFNKTLSDILFSLISLFNIKNKTLLIAKKL